MAEPCRPSTWHNLKCQGAACCLLLAFSKLFGIQSAALPGSTPGCSYSDGGCRDISKSQAWTVRESGSESLIAAFVGRAGRITLGPQPHTTKMAAKVARDPEDPLQGAAEVHFSDNIGPRPQWGDIEMTEQDMAAAAAEDGSPMNSATNCHCSYIDCDLECLCCVLHLLRAIF